MSNAFHGSSKKSATMDDDSGEIWNPTSHKIKGEDGKDYPMRNPNPEKGQEPKFWGYYLGTKVIPADAAKGRLNDSILHQFQDSAGNRWDIWGSFDLDKQLSAVWKDDGPGCLCQIQWNGYVVKKKSKDKPPAILAQKLAADFYHDWEVIVGDKTQYPPIHVEGAEVYKPAASNVATPPQPTAPVSQAPAMPAQLPNATVPVSAPPVAQTPATTGTAPQQPAPPAPTPVSTPAAPAPNAPPVSGDFDNEQSGINQGAIPPPY